MKTKIIKELNDSDSKACLIELNHKHYVVSSIECAFDTGLPETLVFPCDSKGNNIDFSEVAGGSNISREQAIKELEVITE